MANLAEHFRAVAADVIVTTEKDIFNLCDGCEDLFAPLPLFWLEIRAELDREAEFLLEIERRLEAQRVT